jgi:hypothetical protein
MLKVFLCLQPGQEYVRSVTNQLLTLLYWKQEKRVLPFWGIFDKQSAAFGGESIELTFSLLARNMQNDSHANDCNHVSKKYLGVKTYVDIRHEMRDELKVDKDTMKSVSGRIEFKENKDNPRVDEAHGWLKGILNELKWNTFQMYATIGAEHRAGKFAKAYKSKLHAQRHKEKVDTFCARYFKSVAPLLDGMKENLRQQTEKKDWAGKNMVEWDEFKQGAESSDDENLEEHDEEEVDLVARAAPAPARRVQKAERSAHKQKRVSDSDNAASENEEEQPQRVKRARRVNEIPKRDYTNQSAKGHDRIKERYEELCTYKLNAGGHNKVPKLDHTKMWEQARLEIAEEEMTQNGGGRAARRRRKGTMSDAIQPNDIASLNAAAIRESKRAARDRRGGGGGGAQYQ